MKKEGNSSAESTPPSWRRWPGLRHRWIVMGLIRHHISPPVVMAQDRAEISALAGQAVGPPLTHPHAVAMALARHQQLHPWHHMPALPAMPP